MHGDSDSTFQYSQYFEVNSDIKKAFDQNGRILNEEESLKLRIALESENGVLKHAYCRDDGHGRMAKIALWNQPGNDITGVIASSQKFVDTFEKSCKNDKLLGGKVYHYHSKVVLKEAKTGGAHVWHQDYGYWYEYGFLFPRMGTVWLAVDRATKENGCVQVLKGSHKLGRIDHKRIGDQVGADQARLEYAKTVCPLVYCKMEPGDAIFFHCNVLHCSAQNNSDTRRWAFLVAYNRIDNNPEMQNYHKKCTPIQQVPNSAISKCSTITDMAGKDFFLGPKQDSSLSSVNHKGIS